MLINTTHCQTYFLTILIAAGTFHFELDHQGLDKVGASHLEEILEEVIPYYRGKFLLAQKQFNGKKIHDKQAKMEPAAAVDAVIPEVPHVMRGELLGPIHHMRTSSGNEGSGVLDNFRAIRGAGASDSWHAKVDGTGRIIGGIDFQALITDSGVVFAVALFLVNGSNDSACSGGSVGANPTGGLVGLEWFGSTQWNWIAVDIFVNNGSLG